MKKNLVVSVISMLLVLFVNGCGFTDYVSTEYQKQTEWAKENGTLTDGKSPDDSLVDAVNSIVTSASTDSDVDVVYGIGDTISMIDVTEDGTKVHIDLTVTGCEAAYDGWENVTLIFYTVKNKDDSELEFGNDVFTVYADNSYVEPGSWESYNEYSYGVLRKNTTYEGVYVAKVDPYTTNEIRLYAGNFEWLVWDSSNYTASESYDDTYEDSDEYDVGDIYYAPQFAGRYSDDTADLKFSAYSTPDEESIGTYTLTMNGVTYSGEVTPVWVDQNTLIGFDYDNNGVDVEITIYHWESDALCNAQMILFDSQTDDILDSTDYINLVERYQS